MVMKNDFIGIWGIVAISDDLSSLYCSNRPYLIYFIFKTS
ncbi:hypothetical protein HMPREF1051_1765 [Neisseria sicca VK64]|uniref:Uncharacterized protein n=1 Tax=Neisseria sicca VK64 TaxID=1095748 RepID=I2NIJ8_NEISI|nr:hypothetical protein HMPREF1051_1765 [Neisseria sicca VK64]